MICVRCQQGIAPGEPYNEHYHEAASGPGCTNYTHKKCPEPKRRGRPAAGASR
ncbi:hypothetical protein [Streptomyces sp. SCSIO ZS0520]|uniref:hypothetical protein n=1 Tax=Streptomyces sp. SCSIO ZS0520 TaxID=2892996 RepID=UPI0021D89291|nr:hypothetical protein [Streptomyces sp. SCSIO ZS0520]